ncbi:PilW family protein [Acidiferrobacter sp.]|uniref:PilW family protein n=1 Tax=Acidiferrobacter sp. TaxID=1872107 RepID=UPI00345B726B
MSSPLRSDTRPGERGLTLTELLVALVISALAAVAIYGAFTGLSSVTTQTRAQDNAWQQARTAMTMLTQAIEQAGYGLPMNECGGGIFTNVVPSSTGVQYTVSTPGPTGGLFLTPVAAMPQANSSPYYYSPTGINTYALTTVTGGSVFGAAPVTTITSTSGKSLTSVNFFVRNAALFYTNDLFLVALPNSSCLLGQVTNLGGAGNIIAESGTSAFNAPGGFSATDPAITTSQLVNRGVVDLGNTGFSISNFFISDGVGAQAGTQVPSLYMQTYSSLNNSANASPPALLVARGIIDMQVAFGYGQNGVVTEYVLPSSVPPSGMTAADLLTVEITLLVRSTRYTPGNYAGATPSKTVWNGTSNPNLPKVVYSIPTNLPASQNMGCVQGNCNQYLYRTFTSVIPVRNDIWGQ